MARIFVRRVHGADRVSSQIPYGVPTQYLVGSLAIVLGRMDEKSLAWAGRGGTLP